MKIDFKTFIKDFVQKSKSIIANLEEFEGLSGEKKKERLDKSMANYAIILLDTVKINAAFKWVIRKVLIENIPAITQAIFDLIAAKVNGITR